MEAAAVNRALGFLAAGVLCSIAAVACGGGSGSSIGSIVSGGSGGSGGSVTPPTTTTTTTTGSASITMLIPTAASSSSSASRRPAYVSSATKSVAIFAYVTAATPPPTATTVVNVGAGQAGCTPVTGGTSCTITVPATYGSMTFAISTYDGVLGTGNLLSQATFSQSIGPNQAPILVTLGGVVASVSFTVPQFSYPTGGGTFPLTVNAYDASGNLIVGGGTYNVPIYLGANNSSVTFSQNPVTAPGQVVTVSYTAAAPLYVTLSSKVAGLPLMAQGGVTMSFAAPANANYLAWVFDRSQNQSFAFPAGANQNISPLNRYSTTLSYPSAIAVSPTTGYVALAATYPTNVVRIFSPTFATQSLSFPTTYEVVGIAFDANGNLAVALVTASSQIGSVRYFSPGTTAPVTTPAFATVSLSGYLFSSPLGFGLDAAGNAYVGQYNYVSPPVILKFPPSETTGTVALARTLTLTPPSGDYFQGFAVAPDGTLGAAYYGALQTYLPSGSLASTLTGGVLASYNFGGLAFSPLAGDDTLYYAAGPQVNVFAPNATGTTPPERVFTGFNANATGFALIALGPPTPEPTPAAASISGDMLALAPNRTWNYSVVAPNVPTGTLSVYNDPSPGPDGSTALVGFMLANTVADNALPANGGVLFGAIGVQNMSDGYHAESFGSVSNDSFGLVPGAPLIAPTTLTYGQTFVPYPGVNANVNNIRTVGGIGACSAILSPAPTLGAEVEYHVAGVTEDIRYVPGCGITQLTNNAGTTFTLTSIESHPEVGQQSVVRRVLNAQYGDTLRSLWQQLLVAH